MRYTRILFWHFTQCRMVVCYRRFGTNYHSTLRKMPEDRRSLLGQVLFSYARPVLTKLFLIARKWSAFIDMGSSSPYSQKHSFGLYSNSDARTDNVFTSHRCPSAYVTRLRQSLLFVHLQFCRFFYSHHVVVVVVVVVVCSKN